MDGVGDVKGYQWVFLFEGIPSIFLGVVAYFFLPDFPKTAKFLTPEERRFVCHRLGEPDERNDHLSKGEIIHTLKNPQVNFISFFSFLIFSFFVQNLTTNNKQQTTNNKQQTTNNKQQTTNNKQQTTNNKQHTRKKKKKLWLLCVINALFLSPMYVSIYFLPSIISSFGFDTITSNIMITPVFLISAISGRALTLLKFETYSLHKNTKKKKNKIKN